MDRLGVFFGGRSNEHEISLLSAAAVISAIDRERHELYYFGITRDGSWRHYEGPIEAIADGSWEKTAEEVSVDQVRQMIDFAFPVLHGPYGEDGKIQGLFEMLDLPYAGSGVTGSAIAMDKVAAKQIFLSNGIPTCDFALVTSEALAADPEGETERCDRSLPYPMFVKPANMGSSVGISKVRNKDELKDALVLAARYDRRIIVEEGINCREVETGVIGNVVPEVASVGEIVAKADFYDYTAKYSDDAGTMILVPADIDDETREKVRSIAAKAYLALDCAGFARVDFMIDKVTGAVYVNEINTIPGFTKYSMFPVLWGEAGLPFGELVERIVNYGYERYNAKNNR